MPAGFSKEPAGSEEIAHLLLRLGRLLLAYGADTDHVIRRITALAVRLGVGVELFVGSERLLLTVEGQGAFRTKVGHALGAMGINAGRLAMLERIADALGAGQIDLAEAIRQVDAVEKAPPHHPGWIVVVAIGGTAAALARLFGADWPVVAAAFAAGMISMLLRRGFARHEMNSVAAALLTALLSGLAGALLLKGVPGAIPTMCLVAAGMILVPGVPLINGITDLAMGHPAMGLARLANSTVVVLAIGFGLFLASAIFRDALPVSVSPGSVPLAEDVLFSAIAAFGYAMLFDVPRRAVWACMVCGAVSHAGRSLIETLGVDGSAATFLCAVLAGLLACGFGRWLRLHWTAFAFPGVVAMIPGSYAFRAAIGGLHIMTEGAATPAGLLAETLSAAIAAMVMTVAVGIGLLLAYALARFAETMMGAQGPAHR
ncbi:threonine/serine exporter family protein [Aquabacter sp. CN5-332]|uniref:threonine/serine ThrE exporter family protein n=1 Tax=Aquabacter sp. CN5-332 TaxID=3156608 RepID=UPI0032B41E1F